VTQLRDGGAERSVPGGVRIQGETANAKQGRCADRVRPVATSSP
jgi:hypothetical protein